MSSDNRFSPSKLRRPRSNNGSPVSATQVAATKITVTRDSQSSIEDTRGDSHVAIDPLSSVRNHPLISRWDLLTDVSKHIIKRTSASPLAVTQSTRRSSSDTTSMLTDDARSTRSRSRSNQRLEASEKARDDLKKGVKAVSFLSRLMGSKKKDVSEQAVDTISIASEQQIEGNEAEVFAQSPELTGSSIRAPQPPGYIKVRSRYKEKRDFDRLFLAQELRCSKKRTLVRTDSSRLLRRKSSATAEADTIWTMQFSRDGKHLAAAGADGVVRVWKVLSSTEDRRAHEKQELQSEHLNAPVFQSSPVREYEGHEAPVLDLSWSKNNFLISSSMDKTVRLWHLSRAECLCTFKHNDFVPSISFHPKDDRFFLAGSLDSKMRLWDVQEKKVAYSVSVPDMITAVAFMPDGKLAVAGTLNGSCYWYETEGFKYKTQLQIRPDKGTGIAGPKITAITAAQGRGGDKVLVTSNDSKIRLYNVRDKGCEMVFKGNVNDSSIIRGNLSDDGRYVTCGSEDRKAYIWSVTPTESGKLDRKPVEYFDAHDSVTTVVCVAPVKTRRLLAQSEDPIYDLCSSPSWKDYRLARTESHGSSRQDITPTANDVDAQSMLHRSGSLLARAGHKEGNIIVTADYAGKIKVFRQDCAWQKRQQDDGDRSSIFKRDRASLASSLQTKSSQRSLREARKEAMAQVASSDRIMTWRQGIASTPNTPHQESPKIQPQTRESSPNNIGSRDSHAESLETTTSAGSPSTVPTSTGSVEQPTTIVVDSVAAAKDVYEGRQEQGERADPLCLDGDRSYLYWNKAKSIEANERAKRMYHESLYRTDTVDTMAKRPGPGLQHSISYVSQLSDERSHEDAADSDLDEHYDDAPEEHAGLG